jgi:hypothetical protein
VVGITSPFKNLYADYFFYQFLTRPTARSLFGANGRMVSDPRARLDAGNGYLLGIDLTTNATYFSSLLDPRFTGAPYGSRTTSKFLLGRTAAVWAFDMFATSGTAPGYSRGEELLVNNVSVNLEKGLNYVGNPFMAPLDMSDFISGSGTGDWGVTRGSATGDVLYNSFYVMTHGTGTYTAPNFQLTMTYQVRQSVGSTYPTSLLAPMQMFIVSKRNANVATLTIPANKRTHNTQNFLRSAEAPEIDELLIETVDGQTGGFDRLCVVFRSAASLKSDDPYDAEKIFNRTGGVNQIYTRSSDNKDLITTVIPTTTESLTLYFEPSAVPQDVTLNASRLNTLQSVGQVLLEDSKTKVVTDLRQTPVYRFSSSPMDKADRFVLRFSGQASSFDVLTEAFNASYNAGALYVTGLQASDKGQTVSIFNLQGLLLGQVEITDPAAVVIPKYLQKGIYIAKLSGTHAAVVKFSVSN